jgi:hypothetical protein
MNGINILVEAKNEYTSQLKKILTPRIYEGFKSIYDDIINISNKELQENNIQTSSVIKTFQKTLKEIPLWNQDMIKKEYNRIITVSNCDFFDNLIEAVFITNTKILTSVQINDVNSLNLNINIPQSSHYVHKCYMESAKEFYKNPYVFDYSKNISPKDKHNNLREALSMIDIGINNAISGLLPIRDILIQGLTKVTNKSIKNNDNESEISISSNKHKDEETSDHEETSDNEEPSDHEDQIDEEDPSNNELSIDQNELNEEKEKNIETINDKEIILNIDESNNVSEITDKKINSSDSSSVSSESDIISEVSHRNINKVDLINKIPVPIQSHTRISNNDNPIEEYKSIDLNKIEITYPTKFQKIEKVGGNQNIELDSTVILEKPVEEIIDKNPLIYPENLANIKNNLEKNESPVNNPYLRSIKSTKFIKNKHINKKSSFYQKKYEENSAHYNSITDTLNNTINEIKDTENSLKIIKNKIMLKEASSDEESDNEINLEN